MKIYTYIYSDTQNYFTIFFEISYPTKERKILFLSTVDIFTTFTLNFLSITMSEYRLMVFSLSLSLVLYLVFALSSINYYYISFATCHTHSIHFYHVSTFIHMIIFWEYLTESPLYFNRFSRTGFVNDTRARSEFERSVCGMLHRSYRRHRKYLSLSINRLKEPCKAE